jgi:hypothetical protein
MVRRVVVAILSVLSLLPAACGRGVSGIEAPARPLIPTDVPQPTASESHPPRPERPTSATVGPPGTATAALRPCDLLTAAERQKFGLVVQNEEVIGYARSCDTQASGRYGVSVAIFDTMRIEDVVAPGEEKPIRVAGRPAVQLKTNLDGCGISLRVSPTSRVDVLVSANGDHQLACSVAHQAAAMVEAKLP